MNFHIIKAFVTHVARGLRSMLLLNRHRHYANIIIAYIISKLSENSNKNYHSSI